MTRLKELRESKGMNMREVARQLNIPYTTYVNYEKGTREPNSEMLIKIARLYGVTIDYVIGIEEPNEEIPFDKFGLKPITKKKIPLLGEIACGEPIYAADDRESYVEIGADMDVDFCLKAKGDSMINARINDGDIVFIRRQSMVNNGEIAAVIIDDSATLKRVYYYPDKQNLVLNSENPKYEPLVYIGAELDEIHILGKAIAFQSDVI